MLTSKEKKTVQDDRLKLTEHFIVKLPELLSKVWCMFFLIGSVLIVALMQQNLVPTHCKMTKYLSTFGIPHLIVKR